MRTTEKKSNCFERSLFLSLKKKKEIAFILAFNKEESEHKTTRKRRVFCCCCYVYSGSEDESAKEADRGERFFVGCDREVRRYLFQTHSSEIEFDGREILVRSEW